MTIQLLPFQRAGRDFLSPRPGALLADQPGLGKSAQGITAADDVAAARVLVLCPATLRTNWSREIRKFSTLGGGIALPRPRKLLLPSRWTIVNYDILREPSIWGQIAANRWDVVIADEMHRLKGGPDTATASAFFDRVLPACGAAWGLSGTPAPNHVGELFWWLNGVCPEVIADVRDYYRFLARYTVYRDTPYGVRVQRNKNAAELRARLHDVFLRRLVRDVMPELPALRIDTLTVDPESSGVRALAELQGHAEYADLASLVQDLRAGAGLDIPAEKYAVTRRLTGVLKVKPYADRVLEELSADPSKKLVIICWHREVIQALRSALSALHPVVVQGGMSDSEKQNAVDLFQDPTNCCKVFIGQMAVASEGLTLTAAYQVDILESNWVPKDIEQALRRVLRIGQTAGKCIGRFIVLAGSIDELIGDVVARKTAQLVEVFDTPTSTGDPQHAN